MVPKEGPRSGLLLNDLHKVNQVEFGLFEKGVDEAEPDFDLDFSKDDTSNDDDDGPWVEDDEEEDGQEEEQQGIVSEEEGPPADDDAEFLGGL